MLCQQQFEENSNASSVNAPIASSPQQQPPHQHSATPASECTTTICVIPQSRSPLPTIHQIQLQHTITPQPNQLQAHLGAFANVTAAPPPLHPAVVGASPSLMPSSSSSSSSSSICSMVTTNVDEPMSFSNPNVSSDEMHHQHHHDDDHQHHQHHHQQPSPSPTHHQHHHHIIHVSPASSSAATLDSAVAVANAAAAFNEAREKMKIEKKERHATKKLVKELAVCKAILEGMEVRPLRIPDCGYTHDTVLAPKYTNNNNNHFHRISSCTRTRGRFYCRSTPSNFPHIKKSSSLPWTCQPSNGASTT